MNKMTEYSFITLSGVVDAAMQDGFTHVVYAARKDGEYRKYKAPLYIVSRLAHSEKYSGIKPGCWWYSYSTGSIRSRDSSIYLMLYPFLR